MMEEQDEIWERNRIGCPIHKRQEKILRIEIGSNPDGSPMRIARYRVCEWRYAETTTNKYGQKIGNLEKFNRGEENHGCKIEVEEYDLVPIYNQCSECKKFTSNLEDTYRSELDYSCLECFCENTDQQPNNY